MNQTGIKIAAAIVSVVLVVVFAITLSGGWHSIIG